MELKRKKENKDFDFEYSFMITTIEFAFFKKFFLISRDRFTWLYTEPVGDLKDSEKKRI